jgi:glutamyl/glutaminyl-tRNA synthetase
MYVTTPVGRFAPTPSGRMHLGNVFAALIAWLSVRSRNGEMVLRMEDLDTQRTSADFAETLRKDLAWLGLDYDREQIPQSQRSAAYDGYFEILREFGPESTNRQRKTSPAKKSAPKKSPKKKEKGIGKLVAVLCLEFAGIAALVIWWILRLW